MDLGKRIARAIEVSTADVAVVARACNVTEQAVYSWMRGEVKNLRNENLFALADVTGFNARYVPAGRILRSTCNGKAAKTASSRTRPSALPAAALNHNPKHCPV